jgi:ATP-dependent RNA helicase RhlE
MQFSELNLLPQLLRAVEAAGYETPTPIQEKAIPEVLAGKDVVGRAQTGTGKTAAFALPILQRLSNAPANTTGRRNIRTLILSPTRELSAQIAESFLTYGKMLPLKSTVIYGGVSQIHQERALRSGVDIVVATPGRLLDLMQQGICKLDHVEIFVLDEADQMFDMGFINDVKKIIAKIPQKRQTLLFSATMPPEIQTLARQILVSPVDVTIASTQTTADKIEQSVYFAEKADKWKLLAHLLQDKIIAKALVFSRTKHGANRIEKNLNGVGISAESIHGNKSQNARERALARFKGGQTRVLVATDIAARGIDIDAVSHVINYDLPNVAESYVHRVGRTARAGAAGIAISFCDHEEREFLFDIEKLLKCKIRVEKSPVITATLASTTSEAAPAKEDHETVRRFVEDQVRSNGNWGRNNRGGQNRGGRSQEPRRPQNNDRGRGVSAAPKSAARAVDQVANFSQPKGEQQERRAQNTAPSSDTRPRRDREPSLRGSREYRPR